jgi:hypothetical protein
MIKIRALWIAFLLIVAALPAAAADELEGLWKAKRRFGPDARGLLVLQRTGATYSAEMVGRLVPVRYEKGELCDGRSRGRRHAGAPVVFREDYVSPYGRSEVSGPVSPRFEGQTNG